MSSAWSSQHWSPCCRLWRLCQDAQWRPLSVTWRPFSQWKPRDHMALCQTLSAHQQHIKHLQYYQQTKAITSVTTLNTYTVINKLSCLFSDGNFHSTSDKSHTYTIASEPDVEIRELVSSTCNIDPPTLRPSSRRPNYGGGFFLVCECMGRMFDNSFPA